MANPTLTSAVANQLLQSGSFQVLPQRFIGDDLLTLVRTTQTTGLLAVYGEESLISVDTSTTCANGYNSPLTSAKETVTYKVEKYGLRSLITECDEWNSNKTFSEDADTLVSLSTTLLTQDEIRRAAIMRDPTNYNNSNNTIILSGSDQFNDPTSIPSETFYNAIAEMYKTSGVVPNVAFMDFNVFNALRIHPEVMGRAIYTQSMSDGASEQQIADFIGVDELLVGRCKYAPALGADLIDIWGTDMGLLHRPKVHGVRQNTFGYNIVQQSVQYRNLTGLKGPELQFMKDKGFRWKVVPIEENSIGNRMALCDRWVGELIVNDGKAGYLIQNAIA